MRAPHLHESLRHFCLGAFAVFDRDLDDGADVPFSFEEHGSPGRPALYEYRPLVRGFVEARTNRLFDRGDARDALADLRREPAARIYAHAAMAGYVAGERGGRAIRDEPHALFLNLLVPLLVRTAEGCGGFDWDDGAFDRAYAELEETLFGDGHVYGAVAPLVGLSVGGTVELGDGIRVRVAATGELSALWPESAGLLPRDFGREVDRCCVLELERPLAKSDDEVPDAPGELADAVTAIRLATAAPVAAGPVLFERLDWRPYGIRPVLPIAATPPPGEPDRLDPFRAQLAATLRPLLWAADGDARLGDALDRWELALFQDEPFRGEQLRHGLEAALGGEDGLWAAAMRAAALLGETDARPLRTPSADVLRRVLIAVLEHGQRRTLLEELDAKLLGRDRAARNLAHLAS